MVFKYIRIMVNSMKVSLEFEKDFIFYAFLGMLAVYLLSYLWNKPKYFASIYVIEMFLISSFLLLNIDEDVRNGRLAERLLVPVRLNLQYFFVYPPAKWLRIFVLPLYLLRFSLNPIGILRALLFLPLMQFLQFYLFFLIGTSVFKNTIF